eukprot:m.2888 g.2888  ORF g.2888 m.2888 type:complete len:526 (-) comp2609_c0_seq2:796-2373(-)
MSEEAPDTPVKDGGDEEAHVETPAPLKMVKTVDPRSRIATLGKSIKLPGMGRGKGLVRTPTLDGRGGAAGDVVYEEDNQAEEEERMANPQPIDKNSAAEKMAKMLRASQMSRGIMVAPMEGMGLASVMGGKKKVPAVAMQAPYSEHLPGNKGPQKVMPAPAGAPKIKQKSENGLHVVGAGSGGVDEMQSYLDETSVQWGLLRFSIGSGTFKRNKFLLINFSGESCSGIKKAKFSKHLPEVEKAFGDTAAKLNMGEKDELTLENVLKEGKRVLAGDDLGDYSLADMKADYEKMISDARQKAIEAMIKGDDETAKRKTAKEMGVSGERALELVRKPMGAFNWALFSPNENLELFDAGSLSVAEMHTVLPDDQVLCGLIRMGFGTGQFRRTKWIAIWYSGSKVSAVQKGKMLGTNKDQVLRKLNSGGLSMEGSSADDLSLEAIIDKVRRAAVIDGDDVDGIGGARDVGADPFSMDAYYAALEEEVKGNAEFFGESKQTESRSFGMNATIKDVRDPNGKYSWLLVTVDT